MLSERTDYCPSGEHKFCVWFDCQWYSGFGGCCWVDEEDQAPLDEDPDDQYKEHTLHA